MAGTRLRCGKIVKAVRDKTDLDLHLWKNFAADKRIGDRREHEFGDDTGSVSFLNHVDLCAGSFHDDDFMVCKKSELSVHLLESGGIDHFGLCENSKKMVA